MTCAICGLDATDEPFDGPQDGACPYAWNDNPAECYRIGHEREHAIAEEAKKVALKLPVEVSEQKARADAAEAEIAAALETYGSEIRQDYGTLKALQESREALAAARRECEGLRTPLRDHVHFLRGLRDEIDCEICPDGAHTEWCSDLTRAIERIDAALDAPAAGEDGDAMTDWLILRCPQCSRIMAIERLPHDPPTATLMEVRCAPCNAGGFDSESYFDVRGREVTWEAYGGEFLAKVGR